MNGRMSQSFSDICTDLFSFVLYLRESKDFGKPDALHEKAVNLFASMEEEARELDVDDVDIQDAKYAIVALIDETIGWASRLEEQFFRKNIAGEEFFHRLEQIKSSKGRIGVLEIYYICLTLGFEGKYFRTPERLEEYIEELKQTLDFKSVEKLSPHDEIPKETAQSRRGGIPLWVPWVSAAVCVVAVGVVFILLKVRIAHLASDVVSRIQGFLS